MSPDSILSAITIIGSIILVLLKAWGDGAPQRKKEERDEEVQEGRAAIASGDVGAVAVRIDRVLTVQDAGACGAAKLGTDEDTAGRLAKITGG